MVSKTAKVHNLYLAEVMGKRKTCPNCGIRLEPSNSVVSIGEYSRGKYYRGCYACRECYLDQIHNTFLKGVYNLLKRSGCDVRWLTGEEQVTNS